MIPASRIVSVSPRVISGGGTDLETNGLLLTQSAMLPLGTPALVFSSASAVSALFGAEAPETLFAQQYFSGVQNQQAAPKALVIGRRIDQPVAAWIRGGDVGTTLTAFKAISDGALTINVDGDDKTATGIDLSEATSLSDVAEKVAAGITGVTGSYDSNTGCFTFTSETTGESSTIGYATAGTSGTDLSGLLGLTEDDGAILSQGSAAMTAAQNMDLICAVTRNWVGFTTLEPLDLEELEALAAWADTYDDYVLFAWSDDGNLESPLTSGSCTLAQIVDKYDVVAPLYYADYSLAAMALACGASIAWTRVQGMKVWFAKRASGVAPNVTDSAVADALDANRISYVGAFATRNDSFNFLNRGTLSSDFYGFIDVLYGSIYLRSAIQTSCMSGFASVNRTQYNATSEALIRAWCQDPINRCLTNGVIDTGLELNESQKSQIMQETGDDGEQVIRDLSAKGYWLGVTLPDAAGRANRESPVVTIYYAYAGSVQSLSAEVTAVI